MLEGVENLDQDPARSVEVDHASAFFDDTEANAASVLCQRSPKPKGKSSVCVAWALLSKK